MYVCNWASLYNTPNNFLIGTDHIKCSMVRGDFPWSSNSNTQLLASLPAWEYGGVISQHNVTDLLTHSDRSQQRQLFLNRTGCTFWMNTRINCIPTFSPLACSQFWSSGNLVCTREISIIYIWLTESLFLQVGCCVSLLLFYDYLLIWRLYQTILSKGKANFF